MVVRRSSLPAVWHMRKGMLLLLWREQSMNTVAVSSTCPGNYQNEKHGLACLKCLFVVCE